MVRNLFFLVTYGLAQLRAAGPRTRVLTLVVLVALCGGAVAAISLFRPSPLATIDAPVSGGAGGADSATLAAAPLVFDGTEDGAATETAEPPAGGVPEEAVAESVAATVREEPPAEIREPVAAAVAIEPTTVPTTVPAAPTPTPEPRKPTVHTVQSGDTVRLLAERNGISIDTLIAANEMTNPNLLQVGQQLVILPVDGVLHTLAAGESVRQVAEQYGVEVATLVSVNGLAGNPDEVPVGTRLVIPGVEHATKVAQAIVTVPAATAVAAAPESGTEQGAAAAAPAMQALAGAPRLVSDSPPPAVTAGYIAIVDGASGALLYGKGEHERVAMASVTKIATTIVTLQREADLQRRIQTTISGSQMAARDGSSIMGLEPGRQISIETLLYGLMLPSGNDAAEQLALAVGGSRGTFVEWMNQLARDVGLRNTAFTNPSGMDANGHFSSAYDMAVLGRYGMQDATFRGLARAPQFRGEGYALNNANRLIGRYALADGIKIGSTPRAGKTIVASATKDGRRVYVSLMRSQDLPGDSEVLFDWVWRSFAWD